jgi:NADH-quinone oxidoreductase subunit C
VADGVEPVTDADTTPDGVQTNPPAVSELVSKILALNLNATPYARTADCPAIQVPVAQLLELMQKLHDDPSFCFDMLSAHTAIDRIQQNVFELVYYLYSLHHGTHLLVAVEIPRDSPVAPTVSGVWKIAEWQEREVYDLFGVCYDNHPDLRRVFLEDDWQGFPLRKDYKDDFMLTREVRE